MGIHSESQTAALTDLPPVADNQLQPSPSSTDDTTWPFATRIAFRFVFSYFSLYVFTFVPRIFRTPIARTYIEVWNPMVAWVGKHILHLTSQMDVVIGDTIFEYVLVLCLLFVATFTTFVWSWADRDRRNYTVLHEWLRLVVRLWLATFLISYGAGKVFPGQFLAPSPARYLTTYGDSSHMGLLWTFMGVSPGYQSFAGAVELSAGILLIIPQLTTLGALLAVAAVSNVLVLNMAYDVQVKLFAAHLLAAALFLAAPDLRRLAEFFILRRRTELRRSPLLFRRRWMNRSLLGLQLAFGLYATTIMLGWSYERVRARSEIAQKTPFYGIWSVEEFVSDGKLLDPLTTDEVRWQRVVIESSNSVVLQMMGGNLVHCDMKMDALAHTMEISGHDPERLAKFTYSSDVAGFLTLQGMERNHPLNVKLRRVDPNFLLNTRGVRWIHQFPPLLR